MALNIDLWSDHEIIKDAINIIEKSRSRDLVSPILKMMKKIRRQTQVNNVFKMWVPREGEGYFILDPFYVDFQEPTFRKNQSWASYQPARLGLVFRDQETCFQTSAMLQVLGKLANISNQQNQKWKLKRWVLATKNGCLEILESNVNSLVGFSSRENAISAWDTLTEEEQQTFLKGF